MRTKYRTKYQTKYRTKYQTKLFDTYSKWATGEPNNIESYPENCIVVYSNAWQDASCYLFASGFALEYDCTSLENTRQILNIPILVSPDICILCKDLIQNCAVCQDQSTCSTCDSGYTLANNNTSCI